MSDNGKAWYQTRCPKCTAIWSGLKTCHCPTCHRTFTTISGFDKHRVGDVNHRQCVDPRTVGLVDVGREYPCWGFPGGEVAPRDRRRQTQQQLEEV